ncbi:MAG: hypothetical protein PHC31_10925 [Clostridia bacterium]|nr:hypothetical protein [Clostridia bacterium]
MAGIKMMPRVYRKLRGYNPPTNFEPFKVDVDLGTPILLAHPYIHGDAVLMALLMKQVLGDEYYNLPASSPIPVHNLLRLPLKQTKGVYHASVSQFDTDIIKTETVYKRFDEEHLNHVNTKIKRVRKGQGFFKDYMIKYPVIPTKKVTFYFNGNIKECKKILTDLIALGKKTDIGYGIVRSVSIEPTHEDNSFVKDGKCMRPFPAKEFESDYGFPSVARRLAWKAPYWDKKNIAMCAAPGAIFYQRL